MVQSPVGRCSAAGAGGGPLAFGLGTQLMHCLVFGCVLLLVRGWWEAG